jgi:cysteinyl-tRNA synthetase
MAKALLGDRFDIHGGGNDLLFPHHENEIAQSCCANDTEQMAQVWMHNEMLQVEGKKMSKSLGNFFTVRDLLDGKWTGGWKVSGEVIRLVMLSTHYRKPMDWTERKAQEASRSLSRWHELTAGVTPTKPSQEVQYALQDDLNTAGAVNFLNNLGQVLRQLRNAIAHGKGDDTTDRKFVELAGEFKASANLLGLLLPESIASAEEDEGLADQIDEAVKRLARRWIEYRRGKNWKKADAIRDELDAVGIKLKDPTTNASFWEYPNPRLLSQDEMLQRLAKLDKLEALK